MNLSRWRRLSARIISPALIAETDRDGGPESNESSASLLTIHSFVWRRPDHGCNKEGRGHGRILSNDGVESTGNESQIR